MSICDQGTAETAPCQPANRIDLLAEAFRDWARADAGDPAGLRPTDDLIRRVEAAGRLGKRCRDLAARATSTHRSRGQRLMDRVQLRQAVERFLDAPSERARDQRLDAAFRARFAHV